MSYVILLGRGIGLLISSYIYIVIQQRLLFLVFCIFNITAAVIYSIYFFLTRNKSSSPTIIVLKTDGIVAQTGNLI
jgi:hypothetical protein